MRYLASIVLCLCLCGCGKFVSYKNVIWEGDSGELSLRLDDVFEEGYLYFIARSGSKCYISFGQLEKLRKFSMKLDENGDLK